MRWTSWLAVFALFVACVASSQNASLRPAIADGPVSATELKPIELQNCLISAVKSANLATDRPGVLADVVPKEGDEVGQDEIIARLSDDVPRANLAVAVLTAQSRVEIEYSELLNAVDAAEYDKALLANRQHPNSVPDIEVRRLKLAMDRSRLQIDKAKHEMAVNELKAKQAEAELKTYSIRAPFRGVVTQIKKHRGEAVRQGDTILQMVNTALVRVEGDVSQNDIWNVNPGAPVLVHLNVDGAELSVEKKVFQGHIGFVDVIANDADRKTRVWAEVANPENILRPGLKASMIINPRVPQARRARLGAPLLRLSSQTDGHSANRRALPAGDVRALVP